MEKKSTLKKVEFLEMLSQEKKDHSCVNADRVRNPRRVFTFQKRI